MFSHSGLGTFICQTCLKQKKNKNSVNCRSCSKSGRNNSHWNGHCIRGTGVCLECSKPLVSKGAERCNSCSRKGSRAWQYNPSLHTKESKTCPECGKMKNPQSKMCRGCSRKWFWKTHPVEFYIMIARNKLAQEKRFTIPGEIEKLSGPNSHLWRGGSSHESYGSGFTQTLKRQIRDRDDHLCQMPGCYISENGWKHKVHHINYNKKDSSLVNLITLCHSHHARTNNGDREHWTELFQEVQRLRGI